MRDGLDALRAALAASRAPRMIRGTVVAFFSYVVGVGAGCGVSGSFGVRGLLGEHVHPLVMLLLLSISALTRTFVAAVHRSWVIAVHDDPSALGLAVVRRRFAPVVALVLRLTLVDTMVFVANVVICMAVLGMRGMGGVVALVALWWLLSRTGLGFVAARVTLGRGAFRVSLREGIGMARGRRGALLMSRLAIALGAAALTAPLEAASWLVSAGTTDRTLDAIAVVTMLLTPFVVGAYAASLDALVEAHLHAPLVRIDADALARRFS